MCFCNAYLKYTHTSSLSSYTIQTQYTIKQEVFIKGLAESKTFQRVAVHTDRHIQKYKKEGLETVNSHIDELHKQATKAAYSTSSSSSTNASSGGGLKPPIKPQEGIAGFFTAMSKVVKRDLGIKW